MYVIGSQRVSASSFVVFRRGYDDCGSCSPPELTFFLSSGLVAGYLENTMRVHESRPKTLGARTTCLSASGALFNTSTFIGL